MRIVNQDRNLNLPTSMIAIAIGSQTISDNEGNMVETIENRYILFQGLAVQMKEPGILGIYETPAQTKMVFEYLNQAMEEGMYNVLVMPTVAEIQDGTNPWGMPEV